MDIPTISCDLSELRSLIILTEHWHFGRAADALGISQPALTKRIKRLESAIGGALLVRQNRSIHLTEAGRVLRERARALLERADDAVEAARLALREQAGRLRIGFGIASVTQLLPQVLLGFRATHPAVRLEMRDMPSAAQVEALHAHEIDLAFLRMPVGPTVRSVPILHESLMVAVSKRTPFDDESGLSSLASQPFVVCARSFSNSYYEHVFTLCRLAGFTPKVVTETNDLFSLLQLVRAGVGAAIVPSAAGSMRVPAIRLRPLPLAQASWDIALAWRKDETEPLVDEFVTQARRWYDERKERRRRTRVR